MEQPLKIRISFVVVFVRLVLDCFGFGTGGGLFGADCVWHGGYIIFASMGMGFV